MHRLAWLGVLGLSSAWVGCAGVESDPFVSRDHRLGSGLLEIHQINVGWGSSVLIVGPDGTRVLLEAGDTGKGTARVVPYLQAHGLLPAGGLDYTIAGHQHCDHLGGLDEVVNAGYDVHLQNFYNGSTTSSPCVTEWNAASAGTTAGAPVVPVPGQELALGNGARLIFVGVNGSIIGGGSVAVSNENDRSIAVLVKQGGFDYLWASDLGGGSDDEACTGRFTSTQVDVETSIVRAISPGGAAPLISAGGIDVLNVNHHGSESSTNANWMNYAAPAVALIGTGAGQSAGWEFPRLDVVEHVLLAEATCITAPPALVLQTEEGDPVGAQTSYRGYCVGDIMVTTDGVSTFNVNADGLVSEGPNEVAGAGLPRSFALDDGSGPPPPDTQAPSTALTAPAGGATVSGAVTVTASASDNVGVTRVELWVDGALLAGDTSAPYSWSWDTGPLADGNHDLWTEAFDAAGNRGVSSLVSVTITHAAPAPAQVILNEIMANEPGSATAGEFVELVNVGGEPVAIDGWTISDSAAVKHVFAPRTLGPSGAVVVFAGASAIPPGLDNAVAASTGALSLNNTGDTVTLKDQAGALVTTFTYGSSLAGTDGVSMNRNPDATASGTMVLHTVLGGTSSPGKRADGSSFGGCTQNSQCDNGNACDGAETCQAGACVAGAALSCDDGNACNGVETCSPATGCVAGRALSCEGVYALLVFEGTCQAGACVAGAALSCDDGNACNGVETCSPATGCVAGTPLSCDDGNACNGVETCSPATGCVAGTALSCDDGNACNGVETCSPATGCVAGTALSCDDGNACDGVETCSPTTGCVAGAPLSCDDGNACTADSCVPASGCQHQNTCTPAVVASDGFESDFSGGTGWAEGSWRIAGDTAIRTNADGPHSGAKHVRLRNSTGSLKRIVSLAGRSGARLHVWLKAASFESTDRAQVRVTVTPGTGYAAVLTQGSTSADNVYHYFDLDLAACNGAASCEIYFDAQMGDTNDRWFIDDVEVVAF